MATTGAGIVRGVRSSHVRCHTGGLAHRDKSISLLPPAGTLTCGTVAHQQLNYLTFISVREVDRCSGSCGSSL